VRKCKESKLATGTHFLQSAYRVHKDGQVRRCEESERATGTHELERSQGRLSEEMERKRVNDRHSRTGEGTGRVE
jgi:hypothetical protein